MTDRELMTDADIHAFGVEIVYKQLQEAEWIVESADVFADPLTEPQIVAHRTARSVFSLSGRQCTPTVDE